MAKKKENNTDEPDNEKVEVRSASRINDVAKPGETAAPPTGRPVITGHGPMIKQDPMMSGKDDDKQKAAHDDKLEAREPEAKVDPVSEKVERETTDEPEDKSEQSETSDSEDEKNKADETKDDTSGSDAATIDSLANSAESKKLSSKETEAEKAGQEKVKQLIASKKYNVSITEGGHKATSQRLIGWLLFMLLLAAIGVYLAIDAGYLDAGIELPYDLIKN